MGRGLSPLQKDIMQVATNLGFVNCASRLVDSGRNHSCEGRQVSASRAISRLVRRGLLVADSVLGTYRVSPLTVRQASQGKSQCSA